MDPDATNDELLAIIREHTTPDEYEVLILRANGHTNKEAAGFLGISEAAYKRRYQRAEERIAERRPPRRVP